MVGTNPDNMISTMNGIKACANAAETPSLDQIELALINNGDGPIFDQTCLVQAAIGTSAHQHIAMLLPLTSQHKLTWSIATHCVPCAF